MPSTCEHTHINQNKDRNKRELNLVKTEMSSSLTGASGLKCGSLVKFLWVEVSKKTKIKP